MNKLQIWQYRLTLLTVFNVVLIFLFVRSSKAQIAGHLFFKEATFEKFTYPGCIGDKQYSDYLKKKTKETFPKAHTFRVASFITQDDLRTVVTYYTQLSGQRFFKLDQSFYYIFSEINGNPASRIEIHPVPVARVAQAYWPTRIDLVIVNYPIKTKHQRSTSRSIDELKTKVGRLFYDGALREDIAQIEMEDFGPDAEVFVISTKDPFTDVYRFFRRRYGKIGYLPARDGDIYTRDFEIDATAAARLNRKEKVLYVRVEENPMITDNEGNSQVYLGYTFIQYTFWNTQQ